MTSEWQIHYLTDLYKVSSGLSKPAKDFGEGYPFLAFKDVFNNYFLPDELTQLVRSSDRERSKCSIKRGDVFLTRTSETMKELGMSSVARKDYPEATFNGFTKRLRPFSNSSPHPEYIGYCLRSPQFRRLVTAFSTLSTRASLNNEMIGRLTITLPPLVEQKAIANVLMSLDEKIELNRQMNETLEGMARAIFQSWFVDFDPVHDPTLAGAYAHLFTGGFGEDGLPAGWQRGTVGNEFDIVMGQSPPSSTYNEIGDGLPFYQGRRDFGFRFPALRMYCSEPKRIGEAGDTLVSVRAPVGDTNIALAQCCIGRGVAAVRHKSKSIGYTYYTMESLRPHFDNYEGQGTVFGSINKQNFHRLPSIVPPNNIVEAFDNITKAMDDKIKSNFEEAVTLTNIRDTLLPKLISGQLRVPLAEEVIA